MLDQEGVFLPMTDELRTMLADMRRHRQLSGADAPSDDAQLVKRALEKAHRELLEELAYRVDPAKAARINDIKNASTAALAGVSEVDKIAAAGGRPPGWVEAQEAFAGIAPPSGSTAGSRLGSTAGSGSAARGEGFSRGVYGG